MLDSVAYLLMVFMCVILALILLYLFGAVIASHVPMVMEVIGNVLREFWSALERVAHADYP